jgi:hypothetical protein
VYLYIHRLSRKKQPKTQAPPPAHMPIGDIEGHGSMQAST